MKKLMIICCLVAVAGHLYGQQSAAPGKWDNESPAKQEASPRMDFEGAGMNVTQKTVTITGLPDVKKPVYAVVTNGSGEFVKKSRIDKINNSFTIGELKRGLYFVTIEYRQAGKKAFTLNID